MSYSFREYPVYCHTNIKSITTNYLSLYIFVFCHMQHSSSYNGHTLDNVVSCLYGGYDNKQDLLYTTPFLKNALHWCCTFQIISCTGLHTCEINNNNLFSSHRLLQLLFLDKWPHVKLLHVRRKALE